MPPLRHYKVISLLYNIKVKVTKSAINKYEIANLNSFLKSTVLKRYAIYVLHDVFQEWNSRKSVYQHPYLIHCSVRPYFHFSKFHIPY
jgi:hypothetical protein